MKRSVCVLVFVMMAASASAMPAPDSRRLALAKDYIADEQWTRAIRELRVVAADAKDANRDEALFWLAHSEYQAGEHVEAVQTIARLERLFARSRWLRPAQSLRVEIAQRLRRDDVLWVLATPAPPPHVQPPSFPFPPGAPMPPPATPRANAPVPVSQWPAPPPQPAVPPGVATPMPPSAPPPARLPRRAPPSPRPGVAPLPLEGLLPAQPYVVDTDTRIQALVSLLNTHSDRVIPLLREIALDTRNPAEARRAVFALAQSPRSDARNTVVEAARRGPDAVRIAAIREMGRFREPAFTTALAGIARSESDAAVRDTAIVTLGRTGAHLQLRSLYAQLPPAARIALLTGLFNAKDDDELIRIARTEKNPQLRARARQHLRFLATPKALEFLQEKR